MHQLIHSLVLGENAETWIKPKENKKYGQLDYPALMDHYCGEVNKAVQIKEAEELLISLFYNN